MRIKKKKLGIHSLYLKKKSNFAPENYHRVDVIRYHYVKWNTTF